MGKFIFLQPSLYVIGTRQNNWHHPLMRSMYFHLIIYTLFASSVWQHNFVFFCLCVSASFCLDFLYVTPISFSWFLTVLSQKLTPVSTNLFFIYFVVNFPFLKQIALSLWSWHIEVFYGLPVYFSFNNRFSSRRCFVILFIVSIESSCVEAIFLFNEPKSLRFEYLFLTVY